MTTQEAIEAIKLDGLEIKGNCRRFNKFLEGLVMAEEALEKQADIERALERLEEEAEKCREYRDGKLVYEETSKLSGIKEAIEIIKEEVKQYGN